MHCGGGGLLATPASPLTSLLLLSLLLLAGCFFPAAACSLRLLGRLQGGGQGRGLSWGGRCGCAADLLLLRSGTGSRGVHRVLQLLLPLLLRCLPLLLLLLLPQLQLLRQGQPGGLL